LVELGGRYDFNRLDVWALSSSVPVMIEKKLHHFHGWSFSGGIKYEPTQRFAAALNIGGTTRSPAINELYSAGLHQGVSGIEEGDQNLQAETSYKVLFSGDWIISDVLLFQGIGYYQNVQDYISLQPQPEPRLTIRGAFPVFKYSQADAAIYGSDFLITWEPTVNVNFIAKYALINGRNLEQSIPLNYMPSDNLSATVVISPNDFAYFSRNSFSVAGEYTFEQQDLLVTQDFLPAPKGYFLLSASASTSLDFDQSSFKIILKAENLLNNRYRNYLNRLRYFSDEPGRNISLQVNYAF
jgi:iron complex outermembrane receptor protein